MDLLGVELAQSRLGDEVSSILDPATEHRKLKELLRDYSLGYAAQHNGQKPKSREEWGELWPAYQRYAALRVATEMRT